MKDYLEALRLRQSPDDGFPEFKGGSYRPDSTAWAVICFEKFDVFPKARVGARRTLVSAQLDDGRIPVNPKHPEALWPTPIAVIAWGTGDEFNDSRQEAIEFLLNTSGEHWSRRADSPLGHDTAIRGWPWIAGTHSWVEPTAMNLIALRGAGHARHPRVLEAVDLLLNRQLPNGGWNYGNTTVFSRTLNAMPTPTGMALRALSGTVGSADVEASIEYLNSVVLKTRSPRSLGWALTGLSAWGQEVPGAYTLFKNCLERQGGTVRLATSDLAILLIGVRAHHQQGEA